MHIFTGKQVATGQPTAAHLLATARPAPLREARSRPMAPLAIAL
tara:strand:+ start:79 stop:210 length:132 start_codon:yes stop_codon:yes gene_type:complete